MASLLVPLHLLGQGVDTGSIQGKVLDSHGAALPGAVVRAKGPQGTKASESDAAGNYRLPFLVPGSYSLTVSMDGFSTQVQSDVAVQSKQNTVQSFKLTEGTEVITVNARATVDMSSSAAVTRVNLAEAINTFAVARNFTAAFDFAPGALGNSGVGGGNPSIGGASGLENQYIIGGINVTSSGYGSLGAYSQLGGAASTGGVTSEFLQDLDIIEGGQDAQYGGALGGVINASIKSGSNDWRGAASFYYQPKALNGGNPAEPYHNQGYNWSLDAGNPIHDEASLSMQLGGPIVRDKLFFFVGYNPVWIREYNNFEVDPAAIALNGVPMPNANRSVSSGNNRTDTFTARIDWAINERHRINLTFLGFPQSRQGIIRRYTYGDRVDPNQDPGVTTQPAPAGVPVTGPDAGASGSYRISDIAFGTTYYGSFTPNFNVEAKVSYHRSQIHEKPNGALDQPGNSNILRYTDIRRLQLWSSQVANQQYSNVAPIVAPLAYDFGGIGAYQNQTNDQNITYSLRFINNFNLLGAHELKWGAEYADLKFSEDTRYSGGTPTAWLSSPTDPDSVALIRTGASASLRCYGTIPDQPTFNQACPNVSYGPYPNRDGRYRVTGGSFSPVPEDTRNKEINFFIQDNWTIKRLSMNLGLRYTREEISNPQSYQMTSSVTGNPLIGPNGYAVGTRTTECINSGDFSPSCYPKGPGWFVGQGYKFQGELSPRVGFAIDMFGNGKAKLYAKVARLYERVPNDLAVRSFGNSYDVGAIYYLTPDLSVQDNLRKVFTSGSTPTRVQPGTRLPYKDDYTLGYQFALGPRFNLDVRATYRTQGRILEDTQTSTTEALQNYYYSPYFTSNRCLNCAPGQTVPYPGAGYATFGEYVLANLNENSPSTMNQVYPQGTGPCPQHPTAPTCDGLPTGVVDQVNFGHVVNRYRALSVTLQKQAAEGEHFSLQASYRYSILDGNYEGLFRNDNGQSDPNITSLFDFPNSHLTESQFYTGRLNLDTPHALKIYAAWSDLWIKNLTGSLSVHWAAGTPRQPLIAHPFYGNSGEVPGSNPSYYDIDFDGNGYADFSLLKDFTPARRGSMGRNPNEFRLDTSFSYHIPISKSTLEFSVLVQNLMNSTHNSKFDDNVEYQTGILNPDYGKPTVHLSPRTVRLGVRWSF